MERRRFHPTRRRVGLIAAALVAGLATVFAATALAASLDFAELPTSPEATSIAPAASASADFDGDSDLDLAVANAGTTVVTILKNAGTGNYFEPPTSPEQIDFNLTVRSVAAADLDGDGDQDLAVGSVTMSGADTVSILKNTGSGNFVEPPSSPEVTGDSPLSIVPVNVDGDADLDLAVANSSSDNVTILRNNGSGNFFQAPSSPKPVGDGPFGLAAGDFDGDSDQDLATANIFSDNVTVLKNNGTGNFLQPATSPEAVGTNPRWLVAANVDGDADQDLAVANYTSGTLSILRNAGTGNFVQPTSSPEVVGSVPRGVDASDFDLDGDQDLVVPLESSASLAVLRNNGTGNYSVVPSSPEAVGNGPSSALATNIDGDLDEDVVVTNQSDHTVSILRNP